MCKKTDITKILEKELDKLRRSIPYNGMYDETVDKIMELFEDDRKSYKQKFEELEEAHTTNLIERNSYLLEVEQLKAKVLELETELYFERRNKRISEMYGKK